MVPESHSRMQRCPRGTEAELPLSEEMVRLDSSGIFSAIYPDHPCSRALAAVAAAIEESTMPTA